MMPSRTHEEAGAFQADRILSGLLKVWTISVQLTEVCLYYNSTVHSITPCLWACDSAVVYTARVACMTFGHDFMGVH